jgi:hypothetical protein
MDDPAVRQRQFWEGFGVAWGLLLACFLIAYAAFVTWSDWGPNGPVDEWTNIPMYLLTFCGLSQLIYIIPCGLFFILQKMPHQLKGLLLGAASVFGLNLLVYLWWLRG